MKIFGWFFFVWAFAGIGLAEACSPAYWEIDDWSPEHKEDMIIVKGKLTIGDKSAGTRKAAKIYDLVFRVEEVVQGDVAVGTFEVWEGGPFGSVCEYGEMKQTYPYMDYDVKRIGLDKDEYQYLFVSKIEGNRAIVPIFGGYGYGVRGDEVISHAEYGKTFFDRLEFEDFIKGKRDKIAVKRIGK